MTEYQYSKKITEVYYNRFSKRQYRELLSATSWKDRQHKGKVLLDYLCDKHKISRLKFIVKDEQQHIGKQGSIYKAWYFYDNKILIYDRTAYTNRQISIESFVVDLLHEFMHYYDVEFLHIKSTPHTSGFFSRINDLKQKLEK